MDNSTVKRFIKYVSKQPTENGCIEWHGYRNADGYGKFRLGIKLESAHRISYALFYGDIPIGMSVLHTCDNPACVNPKHLFLGTQLDNIKDMVSKNRQKGVESEHQHLAKLDWVKAYEIKWLSASGFSTRKLAKQYGVSRSNIQFIAANKTWAMECHD